MKTHACCAAGLLILLTGCRGEIPAEKPESAAAPVPIAGVGSSLNWIEAEGAFIPVPPAERPRLYLRKSDLPDLQRRMTHPELSRTVEILQENAQQSVQDRVEWQALQYLLHQDQDQARQAVAAALDTMQKAVWPDAQDISRAMGRMMVTGAIVYDWCYDVMTPDQRTAYYDQFVRIAQLLECGYPPERQGSITGHSSERMIMRDMISAGIAAYDENPEMYRLAAGRFFREHVPARNWLYPGQAYHQGDSYNGTRLWSDMMSAFIFKRLGAGDIYHPAQQFVFYHGIYSRRPDGQYIRSGDTFLHSTTPGEAWSIRDAGYLAASYYGDGYIQEDFLLAPRISGGDYLFHLLWSDPDLKPRSRTDLPNARYMGAPFGWLIARTGWGKDCVIAEMKVNVYNFLNHQHLDGGSFQLYHKGSLAIDSGLYNGSSGGYGSTHNYNYYKRTVAHNSLLVYDPEETWPQRNLPIGNDGGQRMPNRWSEPGTLETLLTKGYKTGAVLGYGIGPDMQTPEYSYLKGDITEAYTDKVRQVRRSFVFFDMQRKDVPGVLIVFDRVVARNPAFKKTWLLHSMEEPAVTGNTITCLKTTGEDHGKLIATTLLPALANAEFTKIGGSGKEFWVNGENYPNETRSGRDLAAEKGAWRVELSPKNAAETDLFLNVLQVMDAGQAGGLPVQGIETEQSAGVQIGDRIALFSKDTERRDRRVSFEVTGAGEFQILVADLAAGNWQVWKNGAILLPALMVSEDAGTLYLKGGAGQYELRR